MALVNISDVQAWIKDDRLVIGSDDKLPEEPTISQAVLARLATRFDISTWVSAATTPLLVKGIIAMKIASARIWKAYGDQEDEPGYAVKIGQLANEMLDGLVNGTLTLLDISETEQSAAAVASSISFKPDDNTVEVAKFSMGQTF